MTKIATWGGINNIVGSGETPINKCPKKSDILSIANAGINNVTSYQDNLLVKLSDIKSASKTIYFNDNTSYAYDITADITYYDSNTGVRDTVTVLVSNNGSYVSPYIDQISFNYDTFIETLTFNFYIDGQESWNNYYYYVEMDDGIWRSSIYYFGDGGRYSLTLDLSFEMTTDYTFTLVEEF